MNELILPRPDLEVEIYFLKTDEGGRKHDIPSNYRGQFFYDGSDYDALYQFINRPFCKLGEYSNLLVEFVSPYFHAGKFYEGKEFLIREGLKIVGKGKVKRVLRNEFEIWDAKDIIESFHGKIDPYDSDNMAGFKIDCDLLGAEKEILEPDDFIETGDKTNMLIIKCKLLKTDINLHELVEEIESDWVKEISFKNQKYRFDIKQNDEYSWEVKMFFITWHSLYITGTIEVKNFG